jgi:hypothetical protein
MIDIIEDWRKNYFTGLGLLISVLFTLYISLKKRTRYPELKLLPIYLISFILLIFIGYIYDTFLYANGKFKNYRRLDIISNYTVTLIELLTFTYYFYFVIKTKKLKILIRTISIVSVTFFSLQILQLFFFTDLLDIRPLHNLYIAESIILLAICFFYFIELFKSPPVSKLTNTPSFWVSSGLMFYLFGTLPITIITDYVFFTDWLLYANLFSIINLFYIILFLMIIRGYLCRPEKAI